MTIAGLKQKDLFTRRWRGIASPQKEAAFHIQLVSMLRWCLRPDVLFRHVPNGELRDPRTAAKLKAMGVLPGCADLEFWWAEVDALGRRLSRVLHLELKRPGGRRSEAQVEFALAVRNLGHEYQLAHSVDQAIGILNEYALLRRNVEVCGRRW